MSLCSSSVRLIGLVLIVLGLIVFTLAAVPASANDDPPVVYRVEKGDTLYNLAQRYLRSHAAARAVQRINRIANPRRLPIGKRLQVPRNLLRYQPVEVRVVAFSGPVRIAGRVPQVGAGLDEGEVITTGPNGFISFQSNFGGRFTMPSNSTMRLERARRYLMYDILDVDFQVLKGRGEAGSPSLKDQDRLRLRTPRATTAVRGTDFRVAYLDEADVSLTEVTEGSVNVAVGAATQATEAGFGVASTAAGIGAAEMLLAPAQFVTPGKVQTDEALAFTLLPLDRAKAYRVQLARDAGFVDILSEIVTSDLDVTFPGIEDGRYFVRARGVSASAIEGNSRAESFRRKRLGVSANAGRSAELDGFLFKWMAIGEGQSSFAFQLWKEGASGDPIVDETGLSATSIMLTDLAPGTYQWRVAVMQAEEEGLLKVWGEPQTLSVSE